MLTNRSSSKTERDARIDVFRGLALVMIFINHMPATPWSVLTMRAWGFSDSAEVFVLLAGLAAAFAYGRFFDRGEIGLGIAAIGGRLFTLYRTHLLLFLVVGALCVIGAERFNEPSHLEALGFDTFLQNPTGFLGHVVSLGFLPGYLDILPLYIVLLALLPVLFLLGRVHWALPLALSIGLWAFVQFYNLNLPNSRTAREWTFNPFAWQLIFVIGWALGRRVQSGMGFGVLNRSLVAHSITVFAALFTIVSFVVAAPWREIPGYENVVIVSPSRIGTISKTDLDIIRLIDVLTKAWLVSVLVRPNATWLSLTPFRLTGLMGRHSLEVFSLATVLSVAGGILITANGFHPWWIASAVIGGIGLMVGVAALVDWREQAMLQSSRKRVTVVPPQPQREIAIRKTSEGSRAILLALDPKA
ncbi:Uncharacterised conserved protein UCP028704, OpgC [Rhabdaerophilaceae bacterium]